MDKLLPYYERELAFLRNSSKEFAERYPKIAGRLSLAGDVSEDPHVERMIQSFALMGSRISKKLEDDYPEFTEALLDVLYPHYLRPFPSCSIAQFEQGLTSDGGKIARGTLLQSDAVRDVTCKFRTVYEVPLTPLKISSAHFIAVPRLPSNVQLPSQGCAHIAIDFEITEDLASLANLTVDQLPIFIDGEPSFTAVLRDALGRNICQAYIQAAEGDLAWCSLPGSPFEPMGFADSESLLDWPARSHTAYRLLTEFFAFPEKFGFFNLDISRAKVFTGTRFTLHLLLQGVAPDSSQARLLEGLSPDNFRLRCTPVVNLFKQTGISFDINHQQVTNPVLVSTEHPYGYEVHSIDSVVRVGTGSSKEALTEFRPFYAMNHHEGASGNRHYWVAKRDPVVGHSNPGHELQLTMVDADFDPVIIADEKLTLTLTCSNRDLPLDLPYDSRHSNISVEGKQEKGRVFLLRKPTAPLRFEGGKDTHWRLISHLSVNHLSLVEEGAEALRQMLKLYDLQRSATSLRHIEGIVGLSHRPTTAWLPGKLYSCVARGTEIRLMINEDNFVGLGIHVFALVIDHFFGLYVHPNSFTQLVVVSKRSGEEILRCPPRSGDAILV